jgi:hypothetical protein
MAMLVEQAGGKSLTGMDKAVTLSTLHPTP